METPFFFPGHDGPLFGFYHQPVAAEPKVPFVFCHPFAEEKLWTHRVLVSFARKLAAHGYGVLRFDYRGNGDSASGFEETSLSTARADLAQAITWLQEHTGHSRVSLLGLRLGATIASLAAEDLAIDRLVLWAPIVDGSRYIQEMLRINLATQMAVHKEIRKDREQLIAHMKTGGTVSVDGYPIAYPMFEELTATRLAADPKRHEGPCLVVQADRPQAKASPDLQRLATAYPRGAFALVEEEPFWKEIPQFYQDAANLSSETIRWLAGL